MATGTIKLPPGFVLEDEQPKGVKLPPGFVLEDEQPQESVLQRAGDILSKSSQNIAPSDVVSGIAPVKFIQNLGEQIRQPVKEQINISNQPIFKQPIQTNIPLQSLSDIGSKGGLLMAEKLRQETTPTNIARTATDVALDPMTVMGAGIGLKPMQGLKNIAKPIKNIAKMDEFASEVRGSMFGRKKELGQALDKSISELSASRPNDTINLKDAMYQIKGAIQDVENNSGLASEINQTLRKIKDPKISSKIRGFIDNPETASELSLRDAEDIKRAISQSPTLSTKGAQGKFANWTNGDREMLDLVDEIKSAQADVFPELSEIRQPYSEFMSHYRNVKNMFKPGRLIKNIEGKFGDKEIEKSVKGILPEKTYKDIKNVRTAKKVAKVGAAAAGAALVGKGILGMSH